MRLNAIILRCTALVSLLVMSHCHAKEPEWQYYQQLLNNHTKMGQVNGVHARLVDYQVLKNSPILTKAVEELESFDTSRLSSKDEFLSFYINAYNLYAIKIVCDHYPVDSIRDIGGLFKPVWKKKVGKINQKPISLDEIEHEILRPTGEPRIHFAIVCASMSCPSLYGQPFKAKTLNHDLQKQTEIFIEDNAKGVNVAPNKVKVSKIFDWFEQDFAASGGVIPFINQFKPIPNQAIRIGYLPYDWTLNDYR